MYYLFQSLKSNNLYLFLILSLNHLFISLKQACFAIFLPQVRFCNFIFIFKYFQTNYLIHSFKEHEISFFSNDMVYSKNTSIFIRRIKICRYLLNKNRKYNSTLKILINDLSITLCVVPQKVLHPSISNFHCSKSITKLCIYLKF